MARDLGEILLPAGTRSNWVRLRTLVSLRWMAILGQLAAITIADRVYGLGLPVLPCYLAVGASVLANLLASYAFPENKRLTEGEAFLILLFDLAQLSFLIFLTGGLTNPFALLILAPVTISASALALRTTVLLGLMAVLFVTLAANWSVPIRLPDGRALELPPLFAFGFWLAIVTGILFLGLYARRVALEIRVMADALLATQMALAREQKLTDLGGVVAAAAHELGTPLATIKLVSTELMQELRDRPDLHEDAALIRTQADRCRDILRDMGRSGKDDRLLRQAPLAALLREAAEPHQGRGRTLLFDVRPGEGGSDRQPNVLRRPELIHGLRNLVQNAVDFARSTVWVEGDWTDAQISVRITDDGDGYPTSMLGRIGDPFLRPRRTDPDPDPNPRPEYEGMGLGLFIAKTLLERTGADVRFGNASDPFLAPEERPERSGAIVEVIWSARDILAPADLAHAPNAPLDG